MPRAEDVTIRRLRPGDGEQLADLLATAFAEEFAGAGTDLVAVHRQVQAAVLAQSPGIRHVLSALGTRFVYFVATMRGRVVGSTAIGGGRILTVSSVAVLPAFRGLGLGRLLVEQAHTYARAQGRDRVVLDVLEHNLPARRIYDDLGYREYHRFHAYELPALPAAIAAPAPPTYWLEPLTPRRTAAFASVERASLPPSFFEVTPTLRERYIRAGPSRWLERLAGGQGSHQRVLVHDGRTAGYLSTTTAGGNSEGRIDMPLVLPRVTEGLPAALLDCIRFVEETGRRRLRLDVSEARPDQQAAAEALGFRHRWTFLQMVASP